MKKIIALFVAVCAMLCSCQKMAEDDSGVYIGDECVIRLRSAFYWGGYPTATRSGMVYEFYNQDYAVYSNIPMDEVRPVCIGKSVELASGEPEETIGITLEGVPEYGEIIVCLENGEYVGNDERIKEVEYVFKQRQDKGYYINIVLVPNTGKNITIRYKGMIAMSGLI